MYKRGMRRGLTTLRMPLFVHSISEAAGWAYVRECPSDYLVISVRSSLAFL